MGTREERRKARAKIEEGEEENIEAKVKDSTKWKTLKRLGLKMGSRRRQ